MAGNRAAGECISDNMTENNPGEAEETIVKIGSLPIRGRFVLGPMAGVTDQPFRILCAEQGASLVSMEMVFLKDLVILLFPMH